MQPTSSPTLARRQRHHQRRPSGIIFGFSPLARYLLLSRSFTATCAKRSNNLDLDLPPVKRLKHVEFSSSYVNEEAPSSSVEELGTVQADFAFYDPKPSDFHGVKLLLSKYLDTRQWDVSGFADLIIAQTTVGTVVKMADDEVSDDQVAGDDDGLFAVISVLNLRQYNEHRCIKELKKYLLDMCKDEVAKTKLNLLLGEHAADVGLIVSQRFVNFPFELVPPMYEGLFKEIAWATDDEPTKELCDSFRFKEYLLVTKFFERKDLQRRQPKRRNDQDEPPIIYAKEEDEIFNELCSWSFTFDLHAKQSTPDELSNYKEKGLVLAIKAEGIPKFEEKLKTFIGQS